MLVIPAVDIKAGEAVRLWQGDFDKTTVYSKDPVSVARDWAQKGAKLIHVIDLDGARTGSPKNLEIAVAIADTVSVPVELGGGIRTKSAVKEVLDKGIAYVVLGTIAYTDPSFVEGMVASYGERIVVSIDAREGIVYSKGWTENTNQDAVDLAKNMQRLGVKRLIYTDIARDGTLRGPNLKGIIKKLAESLSIEIFVAGGISSMEDVIWLKELERTGGGLSGIIIGKALYEGKINLEEAIKLCQ